MLKRSVATCEAAHRGFKKGLSMTSSPKPKVFYGYYIVGACFVTLFFCWGMVLNAFPVFVKPLTEDMGWSLTGLAAASLAGAFTSILLYTTTGKFINRFGARAVMIAGALTLGLSLLAGSRATQLWHMYLMNAFVGAGLTLVTLVPCTFVISNWFESRRGTAMSGAVLGTAVGGAVMAPVASWFVTNYSWRTAFVAAGLEIIFIAIPVIYFFIRTRPSDMGLEPYREGAAEVDAGEEAWGVEVGESFSKPVFWLISGNILLIALVTAAIGFHCVNYLTTVGHSLDKGSSVWSVVMWAMIAGKLSAGPISDRWGVKNTMAAVCVLFAISMPFLMRAQSYQAAMAFAVIYGFALGAPLVLNPLLAGDYLGMKNFATIFAVFNIMGTIGGGAGPIVSGVYVDATKLYAPVFYVFAGLLLLAGVCCLFMKPFSESSRAAQRLRPAEAPRVEA
jgi:sugar phosphate permease